MGRPVDEPGVLQQPGQVVAGLPHADEFTEPLPRHEMIRGAPTGPHRRPFVADLGRQPLD
jgi:hypothetical protein